jgi:BCD family chlorophyll transporter-like MFS transporter
MSESQEQNLSISRNVKIGLFHLGSGMADVVTTGIWNRIMISDLGFSATPIGLLVSLRYFLAPLGVWAGRVSDQRTVGGYRRMFWIWLGRAMMVVSILALGITTAHIARGNEATLAIWTVISVAMLLFSLGNALSGSTFLALVYDRAPEKQRGRAVGIVWTFLLLGFTIGGMLFGILLPAHKEGAQGLSFTPDTLQNLFVIGALVMGSLWLFSLLGEERRITGTIDKQTAPQEKSPSVWADLKLALSNRQTRWFFWYLSLSMMFAFAQDLILEPFGGQVFGMDASHTTRFAAYWGSMSIIGSLACIWLSRRYPRLTNTVMSYIGVGVLLLTFVIFSISALASVRPLVTIGLITLGIGLGIWNIGTLGMMMEMSPAARAGTFLGLWTLVVTVARGIGVSSGGILRDIILSVTGNLNLAYGIPFVLFTVGMLVALWSLRNVNVKAFQAEQGITQSDTATVLAGAMD